MSLLIPKKHFLSFLLLTAINALFIFKYGLRYSSFIKVSCAFVLFVLIQIFITEVLRNFFKEYYKAKYIYWSLTVLFFIVSIYINSAVDGNALNVDRWSAMHVGIEALFNGEYPYTAIDHMGGRTSNLPGLLFIGIPFYLLGDVGYLQSFTFLLFAFLIYKNCKTAQNRITTLFLLISSPCYLYEIYVKSDLVSNFILVLITVIYSYKIIQKENFKQPEALGMLSSFIFYTRITAIIPLTLSIFSRFTKWKWDVKLVFTVSALLTLSLLSYIVFIPYPSYEVLTQKNPFILQNRQLPLALSVLFIVLPCLLSFQIKNLGHLLKYCVIAVALPVFTAMGLYMLEFGFWPAIEYSRFDLSYLNMITPFLIFYLGYKSSFNPKPTQVFS